MDVRVHTRLGATGFLYAEIALSEEEWEALPRAPALADMVALAADEMSSTQARVLYLFFQGLDNAIYEAVALSEQSIPPSDEMDEDKGCKDHIA